MVRKTSIKNLIFGLVNWQPFPASFLSKFKNVEGLGVQGAVMDTDYFATLEHLEALKLSYNTITDYNFLGSLRKLKKLSIMNHEQVTDLSPIGELKNYTQCW